MAVHLSPTAELQMKPLALQGDSCDSLLFLVGSLAIHPFWLMNVPSPEVSLHKMGLYRSVKQPSLLHRLQA